MISIPGKSELFIGNELNPGEKWTSHWKWVQSRGKVNFLIGLISIHSGYFLVIYVSANILKCHFSTRNVNPIIFGIWDGKNSLFITQGTLIFPHSWLSSCGKIKIPHSRLRRSWEIFISPRLLSHSWGNINVPFVIHREFLIPPFAASRLMEELSRPKFQKW